MENAKLTYSSRKQIKATCGWGNIGRNRKEGWQRGIKNHLGDGYVHSSDCGDMDFMDIYICISQKFLHFNIYIP